MVVLVASLGLAGALGGCNKEAEPVRQCYESFIVACNESNGPGAAALLAPASIAYYDRLLGVARSGKRATVERLTAIERAEVFAMRCRLAPQDMKNMTGREWVALSVGKGWWAEDDESYHFGLGTITVRGDSATGIIKDYDGATPYKFDFVNDSGTWRLDFNRADELINRDIAQLCREEGITEEEYLFEMELNETGQEVTDAVWNPPFSK